MGCHMICSELTELKFDELQWNRSDQFYSLSITQEKRKGEHVHWPSQFKNQLKHLNREEHLHILQIPK